MRLDTANEAVILFPAKPRSHAAADDQGIDAIEGDHRVAKRKAGGYPAGGALLQQCRFAGA